jgi:ectoine hydroxylase-related dioxygenase (phytanoyl-CoA dioxygenase family)
MEDKINKFNKQGYIHLTGVIEPELLASTRYLSIELKNKYKKYEGKPRDNGSGVFWKGIEMASTLQPLLLESYTHPDMFEIAKTYLQVDEPYLFNDQVVVKLPNEEFTFSPHFDNQYGPDPEGALCLRFKTINCCQILTNMPLETGPLRCYNKETQQYDILPAKAGDIVVIDGNTLHSSTQNESDKIRALYACVYSTHPIGNFEKGYHNIKFEIPA